MTPMAQTPPAKVFLKPGNLYLLPEPAAVTTVLGSCVSITLFHPRLKVGGICHGLLPKGEGRDDFKFIDCAFRYMLDKFRQMGARELDIRAKLFGGATMFNGAARPPTNSVGTKNVQVAMALIRQEGLNLISADTGGNVGRKIIFYTHSGEVFVKRLTKEWCKCNH
jgi:chemotaxis protein CheD